ncbi:MAG: hypothetical protein HQL26_09235 [Candidatus Omnitrophica bacterium]|nr:hypothetical protein [Candidatus Omnitrophota bacterium]
MSKKSFIILSLLFSWTGMVWAGTTELKVSYPSPFGVYKAMRLVPVTKAKLNKSAAGTEGALQVVDNETEAAGPQYTLDVSQGASGSTWNLFPWFEKNSVVQLFDTKANVGIGTTKPQSILHVMNPSGPGSILVSGKGDQWNYGCYGITDGKGVSGDGGIDTNGWSMCQTVGLNPKDNTIDQNYQNQFVISRWDKALSQGHRNVFFLTKEGKLGLNTDRVPLTNLEILDPINPAGLLIGGKGGKYTNSCLALTDQNGLWDPIKNTTSLTGWNMCYTNAPNGYDNWNELLVFQKWVGADHSNVMIMGKDGNVGIGVNHPPQARLEVASTGANTAGSLVVSGAGDKWNHSCLGLTDGKGLNGDDTKGWNMCYTNSTDNNYNDQLVIQSWNKALYSNTSHKNILFVTKDGKMGLNTDRSPVTNLEILDTKNPAGLIVGGKGGQYTNSCIALTDEKGAWDPNKGISLQGWNMCYSNAPSQYPSWNEMLIFQKWSGTTHINAMVIGKNGNVGIGQDQPAQKLDVGGNVKAQRVQVTESIQGSTCSAGEAGTIGLNNNGTTLKACIKVNGSYVWKNIQFEP